MCWWLNLGRSCPSTGWKECTALHLLPVSCIYGSMHHFPMRSRNLCPKFYCYSSNMCWDFSVLTTATDKLIHWPLTLTSPWREESLNWPGTLVTGLSESLIFLFSSVYCVCFALVTIAPIRVSLRNQFISHLQPGIFIITIIINSASFSVAIHSNGWVGMVKGFLSNSLLSLILLLYYIKWRICTANNGPGCSHRLLGLVCSINQANIGNTHEGIFNTNSVQVITKDLVAVVHIKMFSIDY